MRSLQAKEIKKLALNREIALQWHLTHNHYPPLPKELIPIAIKAIDITNENVIYDPELNDWLVFSEDYGDIELELPEGLTFRDKNVVTISEAIESMHLNDFIG